MKIAIVGATGAVGVEMLRVLEASKLAAVAGADVSLFASARSAGKTMTYRGRDLVVRELVPGRIDADVILASAGGAVSKELAPGWVEGGSVVVDNSSAFRLRDDVPLVVPEINPDAALSHRGLIANPNCTTAIAAVAVWPLHRVFGVRRMIVSTYQATSGAGAHGMAELLAGTRAHLAAEPFEPRAFAHPIPFNLIPHIDAFQDNGYTREEMKVAWETRKIFGEPDLKISCTAVRIPTLRAHSEAITLELERPASPDEAREVLREAPGVEVVDAPSEKRYPMPSTSSGKYDVEVGRIRPSLVFDGGLDLFVSGDQLLKGAALNAVQIVELLVSRGALSAKVS